MLGANGDELYVATLDDCYASDGRAEMLAGDRGARLRGGAAVVRMSLEKENGRLMAERPDNT